ncbi:hypothetical protein FRB94_000410 [Tulasnella sp. JGI-2019a]|nr:hypothetical protein FRB93_009839 [Tulasnella sp. JGI-2019a]KAG9006814.1 hypothetical protein FRB94_000410 [Tulasnella sp. JGI-2019a]
MKAPVLVLLPLDDSFLYSEEITLPKSGHVKIGRSCGLATIPDDAHVYFDSEVLSRKHAEVWAKDGKIFIKDTESYNGTFVNGKRLSVEDKASEPCELNSGDFVEFGIDVLGEGGATVHRKISARVICEM